MKQVVFVVSMHRSGSSLIAKGLECCGVTLGNDLMGEMPDNPKGFFEDTEISALNEHILTIMDYQWSLLGTEAKTLRPSELKDLKKKATTILKNKIKNGKNELSIGIKDPRFCRLAKFWFSICDDCSVRYKVIFLVRDPNEVAQSLNKRNNIPLDGGYGLYLDYLGHASEQLKDINALFIRLDSFCDDIKDHISAIADFLNTTVDESLLTEYSQRFYDRKLLRSVEGEGVINSSSWNYLSFIPSGTVISSKTFSQIRRKCIAEQQTKAGLKGYLTQLNWHRIAENNVLREQITVQRQQIDSMKELISNHIDTTNNTLSEFKKV